MALRYQPAHPDVLSLMHPNRWRYDVLRALDYCGHVWFDIDEGLGKLSRGVTLRAMRMLAWWDSRYGAGA